MRKVTNDQAVLIERLIQELSANDRDFWNSLSTEEKDFFRDIVREIEDSGESLNLKAVYEYDYITVPPTIAEALEANYEDKKTGQLTNYWFGPDALKLYPYWKKELLEVLDPTSQVFEWILCLTGDTRIPLLDGSEKTLEKLSTEYLGRVDSFDVYSYDHATGDITVGRAHSPRRTGVSQPIYKVTLDDGSTLRANADHQLVLRSGRKVRVKSLKPGDSLMPFYTRKDPKGYEEVYNPKTQSYVKTHTLVGAWKYGGFHRAGGKQVLHHKNYNKLDNRPSNLIKLLWAEHKELHRGTFRKTWAANHSLREATTRAAGDRTSPLQVGLAKFLCSDRGKAHRDRLSKVGSKRAADKTSALRLGHAEYLRSDRGKKVSGNTLRKWNEANHGVVKSRLSAGRTTRWAKPEEHDKAALRMKKANASGAAKAGGKRSSELFRRKDITMEAILELANQGFKLLEIKDHFKCNVRSIYRVLKENGTTWKGIAGYKNHKVESVVLDGVEDVYCMTVDKHHNFAILTNGRNGIMSGNTGPIGGGKCVAKDTLITTDVGLQTIEELVGLHLSGAVVNVRTESHGFQPVYAVHDEGYTDTITISTEDGHRLTGRPNHRIRVSGTTGDPVWAELGSIKSGDRALVLPMMDSCIADTTAQYDNVSSVHSSAAYCYDLSVAGDPTFIANGFVTHNTTAAVIAQTFKLIELLCLKNPHEYHGLMQSAPIVVQICNVTQQKAIDTAYMQMLGILNTAPYFRDNMPINTRKMFDPGATAEEKYSIELPRNVKIKVGARPDSAISANVISAILDEMSFKELKTAKSGDYLDMQAFQLYSNIRKRIESRFVKDGKQIPSLLCNISSKKSTSDFLEKHVEKVKDDPKVRVTSDPIYVMKPADQFSKKTFRVMIGDKLTKSRLLQESEQAPPEFHVEQVPINFLSSFELDLDGSIRDICGIATVGEQTLFRDPEKIKQCINHYRENPLPTFEYTDRKGEKRNGLMIGTDDDAMIEDYLNKDVICQMWGRGYRPRNYPGAPRFIHLDLSKTGDATGVAMGCVSEVNTIKRALRDGSFTTVTVPKVYFDFVLRVVPPVQGEIDYQKIRQFIFTLRNAYNFNIKKVTADTHQSVDMLQLLAKAGFETDTISLDRDDSGYLSARMATNEGRIDMPYYSPLVEELAELVHNIEKAKGKVDHKPGHSKDVADAWCGVIVSIGAEDDPYALLDAPQSSTEAQIIMPVSGRADGLAKTKQSFATTKNIQYGEYLTDIRD